MRIEGINGVSIIVCCYNSATRIEHTLKFIARQILDNGLHLEVIVVNNNSTDRTVDVVTQFWRSLNTSLPLEIVNEQRQGLVYARKAGVAKARYDIVVFADDDNWLPSNYVSYIADFFRRNRDYSLIGTRSQAVSSIKFPDWFKSVEYAYACGNQQATSGDVTGQLFLWGAGLAGRKELFDAIFFSPVSLLMTGRLGDHLISGDDDEINGRTWLLGNRSYYDSDICIQHNVEPVRLNEVYRDKLVKNFELQGKIRSAYYFLYRIRQMSHTERLTNLFMTLLKFLIYYVMRRDKKLPIVKSHLYFHTGWKSCASPIDQSVFEYAKWARYQSE